MQSFEQISTWGDVLNINRTTGKNLFNSFVNVSGQYC